MLKTKFVFLNDVASEYRLDKSNLRKFAIDNNILAFKTINPRNGQLCNAITLNALKLLLKKKFG